MHTARENRCGAHTHQAEAPFTRRQHEAEPCTKKTEYRGNARRHAAETGLQTKLPPTQTGVPTTRRRRQCLGTKAKASKHKRLGRQQRAGGMQQRSKPAAVLCKRQAEASKQKQRQGAWAERGTTKTTPHTTLYRSPVLMGALRQQREHTHIIAKLLISPCMLVLSAAGAKRRRTLNQ